MTSPSNLTDAQTLELYRVALENVENQSEIATIMTDLGYNSEVIGQGKELVNINQEVPHISIEKYTTY